MVFTCCLITFMDGAKTEMKFIFRVWLGISYVQKMGHEFSERNILGEYLSSEGTNENRIRTVNVLGSVFLQLSILF